MFDVFSKPCPCKGCEKRAPGCHTSECAEWQEWKTWQLERKEAIDKKHHLDCALGMVGKRKKKGRKDVAKLLHDQNRRGTDEIGGR